MRSTYYHTPFTLRYSFRFVAERMGVFERWVRIPFPILTHDFSSTFFPACILNARDERFFFLANIQREWAYPAFRRQNPLTFAKPGNVARARIRIDTPVCRLGGNATRNSNAVRSRGPYPILPPIRDPPKNKATRLELEMGFEQAFCFIRIMNNLQGFERIIE